ncbi:hypothetical protein Aeqsu_1766 [Aequorivita sublithincola DSM 14238]|uniref:Lipocalin-like domain-containing protein n=1 Tax=Aequorivita sublithincola (strain DSM 14238 / LMG 21431 / ACAM 643 / 9-3) TaxID=746697 RepID=I3YW77_AEQSU|nr:lipocalin family protein [Aequorivita sublithincola]AFL81245.1 hypothetical protein Aeqsu_1766 [Aequorivita sublithincola DSM 14238]
MRILNLFLFVTLISITISCSKKDDNPEPVISINATWKASAIDYKINQTFNGPGQTVIKNYNGITSDVTYTMSFSENPNRVITNGGYDIELATFGGQTIIQNIIFFPNGTWSLAGNQLSVSDGTEIEVLTVVELTANKLVLNGVKNETSTQGDVTLNSTNNLTLTFAKQ